MTLTRLAPTKGTGALSPQTKVLGMGWQSCQGLLHPGVDSPPRDLLGADGGEQEHLCRGYFWNALPWAPPFCWDILAGAAVG